MIDHGAADFDVDSLAALVRQCRPVYTSLTGVSVWNVAGEDRFIVQDAGSPTFVTVSARRTQLRCTCRKLHAFSPCAHERVVMEVLL